MGNTQTHPRSFTNRQQDLTFYMHTDDPHLGEVEIYTSSKMPLCYILKLCRSINDSKVYNVFRKIQNAQSPSLVSLYGFQMQRHKCCDNIIEEIVVSYWEYYNLYLSDYLKIRMSTLSKFQQPQFWHIVQICCQASIILDKNNCFYDFSPQTIVITPQGKLKVLWAHLMSQNKHLKYFKYFENYHFLPSYFSPEELELIHSKQLTNKIHFDKCNAFGVGILLFQCLSLTDPLKTCYGHDMSRINFKTLNNIIQQKIVPYYSHHVTNLLRELLNRDPKQRINLSKVHIQYGYLMNDQYELKICSKKPQQAQKYQMFQQFHPQQSDLMSDTKTIKVAPSSIKY